MLERVVILRVCGGDIIRKTAVPDVIEHAPLVRRQRQV